MTAKEKELVKAYKKYIDLLGKAYNETLLIAHIHGYNCPDSDIKLGEQLRNDIKTLEEECGISNECLEDCF